MKQIIPLALAVLAFVVVAFARLLTNGSSDGRSVNQATIVPEVLPAFVDSRDGKSYGVVKIGDQVWMSENLNYGKMTTTKKLSPGTKWCQGNVKSACDNGFGGLYSWNVAMNVCPQGWRLPNRDDWITLIRFAGDTHTAGAKLRSRSGWNDYAVEADEGRSVDLESGNGTDNYGFSAFPAGARTTGEINSGVYGTYWYEAKDTGYGAFFWTSFESRGNFAYSVILYNNDDRVDLLDNTKNNGFSVRCIKD